MKQMERDIAKLINDLPSSSNAGTTKLHLDGVIRFGK
jgi:hypothetical protein